MSIYSVFYFDLLENPSNLRPFDHMEVNSDCSDLVILDFLPLNCSDGDFWLTYWVLPLGLCGIQASRNLKKHCTLQLNSAPQRSTFRQTHDRKWCLNAASEFPLESESGSNNSTSIWNSVKSAADAFYRFSRPHTVIGTVSLNLQLLLFQCSFAEN